MGWFLCYSYPSEFIIHDTSLQLGVVFERTNHFFFYEIIKRRDYYFWKYNNVQLRKYLPGK